jgi:DNA repair protein RadC
MVTARYFTIKDLPETERPRERLIRFGAEALSNAELLALILQTGSRQESAIVLAQRVLKGKQGIQGLRYLVDASIEELSQIKGIGTAKAARIKAALELTRRLSSFSGETKPVIRSPQDVSDLLMEEMRYLDREHFKAILLDIKNRVIDIEDISVGSLNTSIVHPRELFKTAIRRSSAAIILIHNHPSGDPTPSSEDIEITSRIVWGGEILGIEILDHIIIGDGIYVSLKEKNLLNK